MAAVPCGGSCHERAPHAMHEPVRDQEAPQPVRALVEVRPAEVHRPLGHLAGPTPPDRCVREQPPVQPVVAQFEFLGRQVLRPEDGVRGVVQIPIAMQEPAPPPQLPEQWRARVRRQDVNVAQSSRWASIHCAMVMNVSFRSPSKPTMKLPFTLMPCS